VTVNCCSKKPSRLWRRECETLGYCNCLRRRAAGLRPIGSCKRCSFVNHNNNHGLLDVLDSLHLRSRQSRFCRTRRGQFHSSRSGLECRVRLGSSNCMGCLFWSLPSRVWYGWILHHRCTWRHAALSYAHIWRRFQFPIRGCRDSRMVPGIVEQRVVRGRPDDWGCFRHRRFVRNSRGDDLHTGTRQLSPVRLGARWACGSVQKNSRLALWFLER